MTWALPTVPVAAAALTALRHSARTCGACRACRRAVASRRSGRRGGALLSMATAGAMSLLVSELSRHSGPQVCGLVAAIPLVGMFAIVASYRQGGAPLMLGALRGYLDGMAAKAAFLGALGGAWALGAGAWAWPIGLAAAACALLAQHRGRQPGRRRGRIAAGPRSGGTTPAGDPPFLALLCTVGK